MSETKAPLNNKTVKKARLGRGLGSLLGVAEESEALDAPAPAPLEKITKPEVPATPVVPKLPPEARIWQIDINKIKPNPSQPRKDFTPDELQSLANSIREKGILQPIVVRKASDDQFEIIAGERRWRAAQLAGHHRVPVILKNVQDQDALELALIENIQRQDLNPIEEALAYQYLMEQYHLTQQELAQRVGKERATVANVMRLVHLHPDVQEMLKANQITLGQAKVLLSVSDPKVQRKIAKKVKDDRLTVRGTEKLVKKWLGSGQVAGDDQDQPEVSRRLASALAEELQKMIGTKVAIDYSQGKGQIHIHFYSDDELNSFAETLRKSWKN